MFIIPTTCLFKTVRVKKEKAGMSGEDEVLDLSDDMLSSSFTYSFLEGIDTISPSRPKTITIPRKALDAMANMERQYWDIKSKHFNIVVFFKKGKFYELYDADAVIANREFGLRIAGDTTNRGKMRMAGVPEQSFAEWAKLFVFRGHKVGRVEQMSEDSSTEADGAKAKIVPRHLVQILTAGTVTDPSMISDYLGTFVLALVPISPTLIDAFAVDMSRSVCLRCPCSLETVMPSMDALLAVVAALLHHIKPKEIIVPSADVLRQCLLAPSAGFADVSVPPSDVESIRSALLSSLENDPTNAASIETITVEDMVGIASGMSAAERLLHSYLTYLKLVPSTLPDAEAYTAHLSARGSGNAAPAAGSAALPRTGSILAYERRSDPGVILDAAAVDSLELVVNIRDGTEKHSLLASLCRSITSGGKRLFRSWLLRPSSDAVVIKARQDAVKAIISANLGEGWAPSTGTPSSQSQTAPSPSSVDSTLQSRKRPRDETDFRAVFQTLIGTDFERNLSRLSEVKNENTRVAFADPLVMYQKHLQLILSTVTAFEQLTRWAADAEIQLAASPDTPSSALLSELLREMRGAEKSLDVIRGLFDKAAAAETQKITPLRGASAEYDAACDRLAELEKAFREQLRSYQRDVFRDSSVCFCDVGKDLFLVEVPIGSIKGKAVPSSFVERARTTKTVKFAVGDMSDDVEEFRKTTTAKSNALVSVLRTIAGHMCNHAPAFYNAASALSYVDCLMSLASFAREPNGVTMPQLLSGDAAHVEGKGLYHALLAFSQIPVPNTISLTRENGRVMVLTGPNMAGKSTLMRTVALNLLCAQLGGFVFAEEFSFVPVTRIFTRIGARDAGHKGQSTLFVELSETSDILHRADGKSLCLIDELGRGTSTHDGYSLAHAALWHLSRSGHDGAQSATSPLVIFSTHYHALALEIRNASTSLMQLGYMDYVLRDTPQHQSASGGEPSSVKEITFLYKLVPGICVRSFGVEVAVKAGIAVPVVEEAQSRSLALSRRTTQQQLVNIVRGFVGDSQDAAFPTQSVSMRGLLPIVQA